MITVQIGGFGTVQMEFQPNETLESFYLRLKEKEHVHFRDQPIMRETQTGSALPNDEIMMDHRLYDLEVWLEPA